MSSEERRERELDNASEQIYCEMYACDVVATALIDDRIAFPDAVDRIDEITRSRQGFAEVLIAIHPQSRTHRERLARFTIGKVRLILDDQPTPRIEVLERLEAEYQKMVASR